MVLAAFCFFSVLSYFLFCLSLTTHTTKPAAIVYKKFIHFKKLWWLYLIFSTARPLYKLRTHTHTHTHTWQCNQQLAAKTIFQYSPHFEILNTYVCVPCSYTIWFNGTPKTLWNETQKHMFCWWGNKMAWNKLLQQTEIKKCAREKLKLMNMLSRI